MDLVEDYIKPNALKTTCIAAVILIPAIVMLNSGVAGLDSDAVSLITKLILLVVPAWVGWDGFKRGYSWLESAVVAVFAAALPAIIIATALVALVPQMMGGTMLGWPIFWPVQLLSAQGVPAGVVTTAIIKSLIDLVIFAIVTAILGLVGHAAAKYFGGKPSARVQRKH